MIRCPSHIVDCLKKRGVELIASASSYQNGHEPEKALAPTEYFFSGNSPDQWWKVDLKHNVSAHSYYIKRRDECSWVSKWNISVSFDDINWHFISSVDDGYRENKVYYFEQGLVNFRYLRIYGSTPECNDTYFYAFTEISIYGYLNAYHPKLAFCSFSPSSKPNLNILFIFIVKK